MRTHKKTKNSVKYYQNKEGYFAWWEFEEKAKNIEIDYNTKLLNSNLTIVGVDWVLYLSGNGEGEGFFEYIDLKKPERRIIPNFDDNYYKEIEFSNGDEFDDYEDVEDDEDDRRLPSNKKYLD